MKNSVGLIIVNLIFLVTISCSEKDQYGVQNKIILENEEFSFIIGNDGKALSLKHKSTGQECLQEGMNLPVFAITQYRPYRVEHFLTLPNKRTSFYGDSVYREGNDLIVQFSDIGYKATIDLNITDSYIAFHLKEIEQMKIESHYKNMPVLVDEFTLLQLPVRNRKYFGSWLNVSWDEDVAINLLATDPFCNIDAEALEDIHIMKAGMEKNVKLYNTGAALITTSKDKLMDCIDRLEEDYDLPQGVKNRRSEASRYSYFWADITPQNIDEYLIFAKQGGFKAIMISTNTFTESSGHFPWSPEYPGGIEDLKAAVKKIEDAGMIAGIHFYYTKAMKHDKYISPIPDTRLNLSKIFTLAEPLDMHTSTITVEENPEGCVMSQGRRILKIREELIEYEAFTTIPPYQFTNCKRGSLNTHITNHPKGLKMGLLDVDDWSIWVRFDQNTSIQKEIAGKIAGIYNEAGFKFAYFDGAEDVHPPYWYNISNAQWEVYKLLEPKPLFLQSAAKSHFGWHMISMANAYDIFAPEVIKHRTKIWKVRDAKYYVADFTNNNFGWNGYFAPKGDDKGTQPDMYEYVACQAAAWGSAVSLYPSLDQLKAHPRTADNMEVMRRWEEARLSGFLSDKQKTIIKNNPDQEYILLIDETGKFELQPYKQVDEVARGNLNICAFTFTRSGKNCAVYWHASGESRIALELNADKIHLYKKLGQEIPVIREDSRVIVPVGDRLFLETSLDIETVIAALKNAEVL